jgi:hypothetical protein
MTWRVTPLTRSLLTVIAWMLSLAVLTARPDLFVAVLPSPSSSPRWPCGLRPPTTR